MDRILLCKKSPIIKNVNYVWHVFILFFVMMFVACAGIGPYVEGQQDAPLPQLDELTLSPRFKEIIPQKVAVLPFENLTDDKAAAGVVRRCFYNFFAAKKYHDVELYRVDTVLRNEGLLDEGAYLKTDAAQMGKLLHADGLVYGKVTAFTRVFLGAVSQVSVELDVKMVSAYTGEVCWRAKHCTYHRAGGMILNPVMIIPAIVRAALNMRDIEILKTSEDLSREILKTLPEPSLAEMIRPPRITFFAHDAKDDWKAAGDDIHVALVGSLGLVGSFDIADMRKGLSLVENEPGVYSGAYRVMPGDNVTAGLVTGHLADEKGNVSHWVEPLRPITIDTLPPEKPETVTAGGRDGKAVIKWDESGDEDVLEYAVFRSDRPKNGYEEVARTQLPEYLDSPLINNTHFYYTIAVIDRAGNTSEMSEYSRCVPVKPGPTSVSGVIDTDTTWYAGASPIVLTDNVRIMNGATLRVEPGAVVVSNGPGIRVSGRLCANGTESDPIRFSTSDTIQNGKRWAGIVFDNTNDSESIMEYCKIKDASAAVTLISSSPTVRECTFMNNVVGIDIRELSKPVITENTIINNKIGIECRESTPRIVKNTIKDNTGGGILITDALPEVRENGINGNGGYNLSFDLPSDKVLDVSDNWWGSTDLAAVLSSVRGLAKISTILSAPMPDGVRIDVRSVVKDVGTGDAGDEASFPSRLMDVAKKKLTEGKRADAITILACAVAKEPHAADAQYMLGMMYGRTGDHQSSLPRFINAARLMPNNPVYHYTLGLAYREAGDLAGAVAQWKRVLEIDPAHGDAQTLVDMYSAECD